MFLLALVCVSVLSTLCVPVLSSPGLWVVLLTKQTSVLASCRF